MNDFEPQLLDLLLEGKELYGFKAVRSEFEAEGVRDGDLTRLVELGRKANLDICIKIGGCEAVSDLKKCRDLGVNIIVAPMVETPYALSKYVNAVHNVYEFQKERSKVKFLFNIETITSFNNLNKYNLNNKKAKVIRGVVFGRVDFASSINLSRAFIEGENVLESCLKVSEFCKNNNIEFVIGGGVSSESFINLQAVNKSFLSTFETRKIVFEKCIDNINQYDKAIKLASKFEYYWLSYLNSIGSLLSVDLRRMSMLEQRISNLC